MKTGTSILLVVLAIGLCHGQMKDPNYTNVQHGGTCYLKGSDCKEGGGCRSSVGAAECCNVYKGCSYFEPANQQCYPCTGNDCGDGKLGKCYGKPDCQGDITCNSSSRVSECCRDGGCSYEDGGKCYPCTENQHCKKNMGRCIGPDCAKFKKEKIDGCSHEG